MKLTAGVSLKPQHFEEAERTRADGLWFEVHAENYMVAGGPRLAWLERIRSCHPVSLHGVGLSLAGDGPPDAEHLQRLDALVRRIEPVLVSEHLAWSRREGVYFPDLLPFPRTTSALHRMAANIELTQQVLGRRIAIENPSHYLALDGHEWSEVDFLRELAVRTGCGLLLDVNNVFVSAHNLGGDARAYLDAFPVAHLMEVHLAGHSVDANTPLLIDSHDAPVSAEVWGLYRHLLARAGRPVPTLIERDDRVPAFDELLAERELAGHVEALA